MSSSRIWWVMMEDCTQIIGTLCLCICLLFLALVPGYLIVFLSLWFTGHPAAISAPYGVFGSLVGIIFGLVVYVVILCFKMAYMRAKRRVEEEQIEEQINNF